MVTVRRIASMTMRVTVASEGSAVRQSAGSATRAESSRDAKPRRFSSANELGIRQAEQDEAAIESRDGARDGVGERPIAGSHVVERTVRLHVRQPHALRGGNSSKCANLIENEVLDFARRRAELAPAEAGQAQGRPSAFTNASTASVYSPASPRS